VNRLQAGAGTVVLAAGGYLVVALAALGYLAADVLDVAPGTLTRASLSQSAASERRLTSPLLPVAGPRSSTDLLSTQGAAPVPTASGIAKAVTTASTDPALRGGLGVSVRDGLTGTVLWALDADRPRVPASTAKLLSALAVADGLDLRTRMPTRVVAGDPGEIVLVARGDTLLAAGAGNPAAIDGHAGLGDLAEQVATALTAQGATPVRLRLDLSWAPGPRIPGTVDPDDIRDGFAGPVVMTSLGRTRPVAGRPGSTNPEAEVATTFAAQLRQRGVAVSLMPGTRWAQAAPASARELGRVESATYGEVLGFALERSDNTLTENLVRQAAATSGRPTVPAGSTASFVTERLRARGIPTSGLALKDASGLSPGQTASAATLASGLAVAVSGTIEGLRDVIAGLPVSGLSGTLKERFDDAGSRDVVGVPRAKTGTLRAGSSLAGTTVDRDGRLLVFAIEVDRFPRTYAGTQRARIALDRIAAALTRCGCGGVAPTGTGKPSPTVPATPTISVTSSGTPVPVPTPSVTSTTGSPTSGQPSTTPTRSPTSTSTLTSSPRPSPTATPTPTPTPTATPPAPQVAG
jgi:serine-type D-Ala-D-Ala carboxypeptidase/endopeptidase (penicillin-binding protein 4)